MLLGRAATASRILFQGARRAARPLPVEAPRGDLRRRGSLLSRRLPWARTTTLGPHRLVMLVVARREAPAIAARE